MESILVSWLTENNEPDYLSEQVMIKTIVEIASQPQGSLLENVLSLCLELLSRKRKITRAKEVLRLCLAGIVRCKSVIEETRLHWYTHLNNVQQQQQHAISLSSELRFLQTGGNCSQSRLFPFHDMPASLTHSIWRRFTTKLPPLPHQPPTWHRFNDLSQDTLMRIFMFCDATSLCQASLTCKFWRETEVKHANTLWNALLRWSWPDVQLSGGKKRYSDRMRAIKTRKVRAFGRKQSNVVFLCPHCDAVYLTQHTLSRHTCKLLAGNFPKRVKPSSSNAVVL